MSPRMIPAALADVGLFASMPRYGDMGIHAVIDLRRSFSRAELEGAAAAAIAAFPVLGRRYEPRFWRDGWAPVSSPVAELVRVVDDASADLEGETEAWIRRPIAITRERPLRIVQLPRGRGSRLILGIMHLAADGAGVAAVGHVLGAHLYGVAPALPVDERRGIWSALERMRWYHAPIVARDVAEALIQPLRCAAAAPRERSYPANGAAASSFRHVVLSSADLASIRARCPEALASVNDLLVAALLRAAARRSRRGPVMALYTMNLRRFASSPRLTVANTSTILTVVAPREDMGDLASAARAVARVTAEHRRSFAGPASVLVPLALGFGHPHAAVRRLARAIHPVVVDMPLRRGLLVTNVGRVDHGLAPFGADLEDLRIFGPNIAGISVPAVVAYGFRGALHLQLVAPPGVAAAALEELEHELREALELPHPSKEVAAKAPSPSALGA